MDLGESTESTESAESAESAELSIRKTETEELIKLREHDNNNNNNNNNNKLSIKNIEIIRKDDVPKHDVLWGKKHKKINLEELYDSFSEILDLSSEEIMPSLAILSVGAIVILALAVLSQNMVMLYMLRIRGP